MMAINYPGPYEVRINYTTSIGGIVEPHQIRFNVQIIGDPEPGVDFDTLEVLNHDLSIQLADDLVDSIVTVIRAFYHTSNGQFTTAEIWRYVAESFESTFISAYDISLGGSSGTALSTASQAIWTFRTAEGGIMKVTLMESILVAGSSRAYAAQSAAEKALVDMILDTSMPFLARDTSRPIAPIMLHPGQSEVMFKKRSR